MPSLALPRRPSACSLASVVVVVVVVAIMIVCVHAEPHQEQPQQQQQQPPFAIATKLVAPNYLELRWPSQPDCYSYTVEIFDEEESNSWQFLAVKGPNHPNARVMVAPGSTIKLRIRVAFNSAEPVFSSIAQLSIPPMAFKNGDDSSWPAPIVTPLSNEGLLSIVWLPYTEAPPHDGQYLIEFRESSADASRSYSILGSYTHERRRLYSMVTRASKVLSPDVPYDFRVRYLTVDQEPGFSGVAAGVLLQVK